LKIFEGEPNCVMNFLRICVALMASGALPLIPLPAQDAPVIIEVPPAIELLQPPPGIVAPTNFPAGPAKTNSPALSDEDKRLQALLKLPFDRRPTAVLQSLAKQAAGDPAVTNEVQRFQAEVVTGNWKAVAQFLKKLPEKHATQVFDHLLQELQKGPQPQMNVNPDGSLPPSIPVPGQPQMANMASAAVLFPDDVLELADAMPGDLTEAQVEKLGKLLSVALSRGNFSEPVIARLEQGTSRLGGTDTRKRALAVMLLVSANRLTEAGRFLPPLELAMHAHDIKSLDLHARYLTALGREGPDSGALRKAWDVSHFILSATNAAANDREQSLSRALELMPLLRNELGTNWLRQSFETNPEQGLAVIAAVGNLVSQNFANRDTELRRRNLELQRRAVDALVAVIKPKAQPWNTALNILALGWVQEAENSKLRFLSRRNMYPQFDQFGNPNYDGSYYPGMYQDPNQPPFIQIPQLLPTAPSEPWLAVLDESLRPRVWAVLADLHLKIDEEEKALSYIELLAPKFSRGALNLANELLRSWARSHDPNQAMMGNRYGAYGPMWYGPGSPYGTGSQGTPLTRAMQARNIRLLSELLARLRKLPLEALDEKAVVGAFSASHSLAEVFRLEDIEHVFGAIDKIRLETLAELFQTMRQRLAGQWRQPNVQQAAQTKRSDKEIDAEIVRGYQLVSRLIDQALARQPNEWRLHLVKGAATFDWAEFDYGKKVDLAIYIEKRDRAFREFERAAELYADEVPLLDEKKQSPLAYQQWFNATLGASDLAYLTRQQEPSTNHLDKIRNAILALPADAAERHLAAFGKALSESVNTLKPELKPRYLRAGMRIAGNHESAAEARKLATYYDDLLHEIYLDVRVDGDAAVGHTQPFGVFISLRHTESLGRESGGFAKYLQNQQNNQYFNPYGQQPPNYRDDFEKQVRQKWGDGFEVFSVTFHEDKVQARGFGRPGWRETPYAYALLKAKDAAVDRLPPLQLDMDFFDRRGQVVLPVVAQTQLIDARPDSAPARPVRAMVVTEILDERDLPKGKLTVELKATGKGIIPELKELFDLSFTGFRIEKISEPGVVINKMDTEGEQVAPLCERNAIITLNLASAKEAPPVFRFPKARRADIEVGYKRYADVDLIAVKPELALSGVPLTPRKVWPWMLAGAVLAGAALLGVYHRTRRQTATAVEAPEYVLPEQVTPFTVLALLKRMQQDSRLALGAERRSELGQTIGELEKHFFGRPGANGPQPDLEQTARQWLMVVE
jgi:hypothetical protein